MRKKTDNSTDWHKQRPIRISADDPETQSRAAGMIETGDVIVVEGLSKGEAHQAAALVSIALIEAAEEAKLARTIADAAAEEARVAESRVRRKPAPQKARSAQELVDEWLAKGRPAPTRPVMPREPTPGIPYSERGLATAEELRNPPKTLKRTDLVGIGKWSEAIAAGKTRLVD